MMRFSPEFSTRVILLRLKQRVEPILYIILIYFIYLWFNNAVNSSEYVVTTVTLGYQ
jgi:hypothetical protein